MSMSGCFRRWFNQWGEEWSKHSEFILFHLEGCNFRMGEEFHTISTQMHIFWTGGNFLQALLKNANKRTGLYGFESHQTGSGQKMEVYYECILKLTNNLHHKVDDNLLTSQIGTLFVGNQSGGMKWNIFFFHKEATMTCKSMGDANEYQKLLKPPPKSKKIANSRKSELVCS
jgi:hypothetical protein